MTYDDLMRDSGQIFYAVGDIFISLGKEFVQGTTRIPEKWSTTSEIRLTNSFGIIFQNLNLRFWGSLR